MISPDLETGISPLLLFIGEHTLRPLYYRSFAREHSSAYPNAIDAQLKDLRSTQWKKGPLLMFSREAYSLSFVNHLLRNTYRFFIELPSEDQMFLAAVKESSSHIQDTVHYYEPFGIYMWKKIITVEAPRRGRGANSYALTLFLCLSPTEQITQQKELGRAFLKGKAELEQEPSRAEQDFYAAYYHIHRNEEGGLSRVEHNRESQRNAMRTCGLRGFLSSHPLSPERAYQYIQTRDRLEPGFTDFLSRMRRPKHRLEEHSEAKLFLAFLRSVIESWILSVMDSYLLSDTHSYERIREELLEAFWKKPAGGAMAQGSWNTLSQEAQKLFYIFSLTEDSDLPSQIAQTVKRELKQRKRERGLRID